MRLEKGAATGAAGLTDMKLKSVRWIVPFVMATAGWAAASYAQGIVIPGAGPVNRSMAGAGVAAPLDAAGAIHWNPASITALDSSEFVIGAELLYLNTHIGSSVAAGAFGPDAPPVSLSGETRSDSGVSVLPTVAVAFQPQDSPWTFGLGLFSVGGFGMNLPASPAAPPLNPILSPSVGVGSVYSKLAVLQLVPTAALKLSDRLSIGLAPTISIADAALDPNFLAAPDGSGYPSATHTRTHWGLGFQVGIYYETENDWHFGASYKSPQWLEEFTFYSVDGAGDPRTDRLNVDYPAIVSIGAAYYGLLRTVWAIDARYVDYANTQLFGDNAGFGENLAATGLGWQSVFSVATGVQYQLTDALSARVGYVFSENPIPDENTFYNVGSTAIYQHIVSVGASWRLTGNTSLVIAYLKAFENSISGPWEAPGAGPLPGTSVTARQTIDCLVTGLQVKF
jgi:long-chain fatty acid transport protein